MNVTINDIARATGLSTATISKYINHKKIREENRILIEKAIQELGYTPNRNAQLLRAKNTHTIGILISDLGNYFWGELVNSIIKHFTDHGYTVIVCSFFFEHQKEIDTIQDIISQHFDGVIMLPSCWHDDLYQLLQNAGIPVVLLDQIPASMRHFPVDCVISDNYKGRCTAGRAPFGKRPHKGLDHGTVSGRLHHRAADPGLCGCISEKWH